MESYSTLKRNEALVHATNRWTLQTKRWARPDTKVHTIWLHLHEVQKRHNHPMVIVVTRVVISKELLAVQVVYVSKINGAKIIKGSMCKKLKVLVNLSTLDGNATWYKIFVAQNTAATKSQAETETDRISLSWALSSSHCCSPARTGPPGSTINLDHQSLCHEQLSCLQSLSPWLSHHTEDNQFFWRTINSSGALIHSWLSHHAEDNQFFWSVFPTLQELFPYGPQTNINSRVVSALIVYLLPKVQIPYSIIQMKPNHF